MTIVFEQLPAWPGGLLAAEYDRERDVICVNSVAVARIRARLGARAADRFAACAIAHERFHRERPAASEAQTRAAIRAEFGAEVERYEAILRE